MREGAPRILQILSGSLFPPLPPRGVEQHMPYADTKDENLRRGEISDGKRAKIQRQYTKEVYPRVFGTRTWYLLLSHVVSGARTMRERRAVILLFFVDKPGGHILALLKKIHVYNTPISSTCVPFHVQVHSGRYEVVTVPRAPRKIHPTVTTIPLVPFNLHPTKKD